MIDELAKETVRALCQHYDVDAIILFGSQVNDTARLDSDINLLVLVELGAGVQARLQMEAPSLVRDIKRILVWARVPDRAESYAAEMSAKLAIPVSAVERAESVVRESDIVVTTTSAKAPIVQAEWLHPGLHLTAMGSEAEGKNELYPQVLSKSDTYVCNRRAQMSAPRRAAPCRGQRRG